MIELLEILILFTESLILLQCIQVVFGKTLKNDKCVWGTILIDVLIYMLINRKILPVICSVIVYLLFYLLCYCKFRLSYFKTLIRLIISILMMGCSESVAAFLMYIFSVKKESMAILFLSSIFALLLTWILKRNRHVFGKMVAEEGNFWRIVSLVIYIVLIGVLLVDYHVEKSSINICIVLALSSLIALLFYSYRFEQAQSEIAKKNYDLKLQKVYGEAYENLLYEVRRRQHDYKNQLGAIYGMHVTAKSLDDLIGMQKEYGGMLLSECKFDSILTGCNNPTLAGFLYYKCVTCEKNEVKVEYVINVEQATCSFSLHEIIEILGILIDNACENVKSEISLQKLICLKILEGPEKLVLFVSNPARYIKFSEIEKMFRRGYSSKGENRGIGLERVMELINKYDAEIAVFNSASVERDNWINFEIQIPK